LRITLTQLHTNADIEALISALHQVWALLSLPLAPLRGFAAKPDQLGVEGRQARYIRPIGVPAEH
jgi:hypothetical protein